MYEWNPCGYISRTVFLSQKHISSYKSKTFFILRDCFNPSNEEKVIFPKFFFSSDFNNLLCFISSCRERCFLQIRMSTGTFDDRKMCTSYQIMSALCKPCQRLCIAYPALENKLHSLISHYCSPAGTSPPDIEKITAKCLHIVYTDYWLCFLT